jgi:3-(3-hydroxy-phenyl)propionate hydroxylase
MARVRAMLGPGVEFGLEWVSVYTFQCRRLEKFRHGRVVFVGDAAHQVSPFGARGGNGGVQDVDNLGWKLDAVLRGAAGEGLLDSYDAERVPAADENILNSTRSTDFITPKSGAALAYRDAVLELAGRYPFARALVNSGRLSRPSVVFSGLCSADHAAWMGGVAPGAPAVDAPVVWQGRADWLLRQLDGFVLLVFGAPGDVPVVPEGVRVVCVARTEVDGAVWDREGVVAARYAAGPGCVVLFRPDQIVAGRWVRFSAEAVGEAVGRALGR